MLIDIGGKEFRRFIVNLRFHLKTDERGYSDVVITTVWHDTLLGGEGGTYNKWKPTGTTGTRQATAAALRDSIGPCFHESQDFM